MIPSQFFILTPAFLPFYPIYNQPNENVAVKNIFSNIRIKMLKKNMPWHIRVSRAVACDNLQPRVNAHHWHIRAFFIGELPPNFLLQKTLSAQANYGLFQECL